jgi:hypothetical protein
MLISSIVMKGHRDRGIAQASKFADIIIASLADWFSA